MPRALQFARNLERFRLVTFDVTDTLLKFRRPPAVQYAKTAAQFGVTDINQGKLESCFRQEFKKMQIKYPNFGCHAPNMSWQTWWIELVEQIFQCAIPNMSPEKMRMLAEELLHVFRTSECWVHIPGSKELVQKMRKANKTLGIISNFDPSLCKVLHAMELDDELDFVLTSYDAGIQKPNSKIFEVALERAHVQAHEALHIGNIYEIDYLGATNSGWSSLLVASKLPEGITIHETHLHASINDMIDALETKGIVWN